MARCGSRVSGCARARARFGWLEPGLSSRRDRALSRGSGAYHREPAFVEPYVYKDDPLLQTKYSCPNPGQEEMAERNEKKNVKRPALRNPLRRERPRPNHQTSR